MKKWLKKSVLFNLNSTIKVQFRIFFNPSGAKTQDVPRNQLLFLLYIVFFPYPVTRRAGADIPALLTPAPWYTSGNC